MHIDSKLMLKDNRNAKDKKSREGKIGLVLIKDISKIVTSSKTLFSM